MKYILLYYLQGHGCDDCDLKLNVLNLPFLSYWSTSWGDKLVNKPWQSTINFFLVEAMFHHCCLFISCLKIFGNLSLYFKLSAITSNIFRRHNSETAHSRETSTEYSDPETTGCIKEGNETILCCCNIKFSAQQKKWCRNKVKRVHDISLWHQPWSKSV